MKRIFNRIIIAICVLLVIPASALAWTPPAGWDNWNAALGSVSTSIIPGTDATYDLGSTGSNWRTGYYSTSIVVDSAFWMGIGSGAGRIVWTDAATDTVAIMNADVGIGVTPVQKLHVHENSGSDNIIKLTNNDTGSAWNKGVDLWLDSSEDFRIWQYSSAEIQFGINNALRMVIDNTGKLGIGDTTPDDLVDITGGALRIQAQADDFAIVNTTSLGLLKFFGDDDTASANEIAAQLEAISTGTWTDGAEKAKLVISTINAGTLTAAITISDTQFVQLSGDSIGIDTSQSPASNAACTTGEIAWDASYLYVCTASTVWKRVALTGGY